MQDEGVDCWGLLWVKRGRANPDSVFFYCKIVLAEIDHAYPVLVLVNILSISPRGTWPICLCVLLFVCFCTVRRQFVPPECVCTGSHSVLVLLSPARGIDHCTWLMCLCVSLCVCFCTVCSQFVLRPNLCACMCCCVTVWDVESAIWYMLKLA